MMRERRRFAEAGETISYSFTMTNAGNVTLTNVGVTDPLVTVVSAGPVATRLRRWDWVPMRPAGRYTLTQADVDAGSAQTRHGDCDRHRPPGPDAESDGAAAEPGSDGCEDGLFNERERRRFAHAGETISYSFTMTNSGNVTLTNVGVTDPAVA